MACCSMKHLILILPMAVAAVSERTIGGKVLIENISNKESLEGLSLDMWQWPQQLPMGQGNKLYRESNEGSSQGL